MKHKILIIRFSSIGDIVLTSPVVRCLAQQVEGAEIHFAAKLKYAPILLGNPYITKIHFLRDKVSDLLPQLEAENFDYVIDLHQNFRSNRIKYSLNKPFYSYNKLNFKKWLLVSLKINKLPEIHIVDRYLETLSKLKVVNDHKGLDYFIPKGEEFDFQKLPERFRTGYVAVVISGTYYTKRLPVNKLIEICDQIDAPMIIIGGKREIGEGFQVAKHLGNKAINLTGKTTLSESASLVKDSSVVLTNDTGLMHIAAAFHKKVLSFWGNTVREFGMTPYYADPDSKMLEVSGIKCRPCAKLGYQKCPRRHFRCMNEINTSEAVSWIRSNLPEV